MTNYKCSYNKLQWLSEIINYMYPISQADHEQTGIGVGLIFRVSAHTVFWRGAKWGFYKFFEYFCHFSFDFDKVSFDEFLAKYLIEWTPPLCLLLFFEL